MESQNHRIFWVRKDLKDYLIPIPLLLVLLFVLFLSLQTKKSSMKQRDANCAGNSHFFSEKLLLFHHLTG